MKTLVISFLLLFSFTTYSQLDTNDFVTTWKTDNPGSLSNDSAITINTVNFFGIPAAYNYDVDWDNDGVFDTLGVTGNVTHQYTSPGTYTIRIRGVFPGLFNMGNAPGCWVCIPNDSKKLISIDQWGSIQWEIMQGAYALNTNLNITATDAPNLDSLKGQHLAYTFQGASSLNANINHWDVSSVTNMSGMFLDATSFNSLLRDWDVSSVTDMSYMFSLATSFNQNLGDWDLSNSPNMGWMLDNSGLSTANYDSTLIGWYNQNPPDSLAPFITTGLTYCLGKNARDSLIAHGWLIFNDVYDCARYDDFVTTHDLSLGIMGAPTGTVWINDRTGYTYNYNVDWDNDGIFDTLGVTGSISHQYGHTGLATIRISGEYPAINFGGLGAPIISVDQWGNQVWKNLEFAFQACLALQTVGNDAPILDSVTSLANMFNWAFSFNDNLDHWDVSNITKMDSMFFMTDSFNGNITSWDVSNVTSMKTMFYLAKSFNQDIGNWDVSAVTDMLGMFSGAITFNQDIRSWDVGNVQRMGSMFGGASSFNQNLGEWEISSVQNLPGSSGGWPSFPINYGIGSMFQGTSMSVSNYDSTIIGWQAKPHPLTMQMWSYGLKYCHAKNARDSLIADGWTIIGDSLDCSSNPLNDFVTTWKTDNPGTLSNDSSVFITADTTNYAFNYDVDWNNDGVFDTLGVTGSISHQYAAPGTYTIRIRGDFPAINFGGTPTGYGQDCRKLISVDQWGTIPYKRLFQAFITCDNMNINASDAPVLDSINPSFFGLKAMFMNCASLDANISQWDVSSVINMENMFLDATSFNQNLGDWDLSSAPYLKDMLSGTALSTQNYDSTLIGWYSQNLPDSLILGAWGLTYCLAKNERDSLIADGWNIIGDTLDASCSSNPLNDFVTTWKTDNPGGSNNSSVTIHIDTNYSYNYNIDWNNDGVFDTTGITTSFTIQYPQPDTVTIRISGDFPSIRFGKFTGLDGKKLISIDQWGNQVWKSLESAFAGCENVNFTATDTPVLDSINSLAGFLEDAKSFNSNINDWDVSGVTNMHGVFWGARSFNQPLDNWDVSNVTNMERMFSLNINFNQPLNTWNVSHVKNMRGMFEIAPSFDQTLATWNLDSAINLSEMLNNSGLSVANYDSTLIGWYNQSPPNNLFLGAVGLRYCLAETARDSLIANGWTFYGDTLDCSGVSIPENGLSMQAISVYPNPSTGIFTIQFANHSFSGALEIYTISGKRVYSQTVENKVQLDLDLQLAKGIYLLKLSSQNQNLPQRLIIQ